MKMAIIIEGGLVQSIVTDDLENFPEFEDIMVIDYDSQGFEPDEISLVPQSDGGVAEALVGHLCVEEASIDLDGISVMVPPLRQDARGGAFPASEGQDSGMGSK